MVKDECSIIVKRPVAEVFQFVAIDFFENRPKWTPGIVKLEKTSIGPVGVGTTGKETIRDSRGRLGETSFTITEYELNKKFGARATSVFIEPGSGENLQAKRKSPSSQTQGTYAFEPLGSDTRITYASQWEVGGFYGLTLPLWGDYYRKTRTQHLYNLARALGMESEVRVRRKPPLKQLASWLVFFFVFAVLLWIQGARDQLHLEQWMVQVVRLILIVMILILFFTYYLFARRKPA